MLLEAKDMVKSYGGRTVVDRVNYSVDAGEIVGLLGSNGAGKTTSFRITVGMIKPEGGTSPFHGVDAPARPMSPPPRAGPGRPSQDRRVRPVLHRPSPSSGRYVPRSAAARAEGAGQPGRW